MISLQPIALEGCGIRIEPVNTAGPVDKPRHVAAH